MAMDENYLDAMEDWDRADEEAREAAEAAAQPPGDERKEGAVDLWVCRRESDGQIVDVASTRKEAPDYDGCTWYRMVEAKEGAGSAVETIRLCIMQKRANLKTIAERAPEQTHERASINGQIIGLEKALSVLGEAFASVSATREPSKSSTPRVPLESRPDLEGIEKAFCDPEEFTTKESVTIGSLLAYIRKLEAQAPKKKTADLTQFPEDYRKFIADGGWVNIPADKLYFGYAAFLAGADDLKEAPLTWTQEKPTREGWYWCSDDAAPGGWLDYVHADREGTMLLENEVGREALVSETPPYRLWYGPITCPEKPIPIPSPQAEGSMTPMIRIKARRKKEQPLADTLQRMMGPELKAIEDWCYKAHLELLLFGKVLTAPPTLKQEDKRP